MNQLNEFTKSPVPADVIGYSNRTIGRSKYRRSARIGHIHPIPAVNSSPIASGGWNKEIITQVRQMRESCSCRCLYLGRGGHFPVGYHQLVIYGQYAAVGKFIELNYLFFFGPIFLGNGI